MNCTLRIAHIGAWMLLALTLAAPAAHGQAIINVNSPLQVPNPGPGGPGVGGNADMLCQLSEAIRAANTNLAVDGCVAGSAAPAVDIIMIPAGTYTFTAVDHFVSFFSMNALFGLPDINEAVNLQGGGAASTMLERSSAGGTPTFLAITVNSGTGPVTINDLTFRNFGGPASLDGGLITVFAAPLVINNSVLENNVIASGSATAGIAMPFACQTITINNSTFQNNTNTLGGNGTVLGGGPGFIGQGACGTITVSNSTFANNQVTNGGGGAIAFGAGTLTISNSLFIGNTATQSGGAISSAGVNGNQGAITISNSHFSGNNSFAGGAISTGQDITLVVQGSTFSNNTARDAGAITHQSIRPLGITNSTFSGNSSFAEGGAILINTTNAPPTLVNLSNVTIVGNSSAAGGGGGLSWDGTISIRNSIVAGSFPLDFFGTPGRRNLISDGHNVFGEASSVNYTPGTGDQVGTAANPLNPLVGGLANNGSTVMAGSNVGGQTPQVVQTMGLLTGSPALNMGDPGVPGSGSPACEATDQRGIARPQPVGGVCDVGAFEDLSGVGVPANFDLTLMKTDSPDPVVAGNNVTYTLTVTNNGPDPAAAVMLTDTLPTGVNFVSATPSNAPAGTCMQAAGTVTCNLGTMSSGASITVTIVVTVTGAAVSPINNSASVSATGTELTAADNSAMASTVVTGVDADLSLAKLDTPDPVNVGATLTYNLTVTNNGSANATNVVLTDTLPANVTFGMATPSQSSCSQAAGVVTCNLGTINNGAMATVAITVTPLAAAGGTAVNNTASVSATENDPNLMNNSASAMTTVNAVAELSVTNTDAPDPVNAGSNVTYTVTVANAGPNNASNVMLSDTLPANSAFVSAMPSQGMCAAPAAGVVTCNLGAIASGANANVMVVVTPGAAAVPSITNTASASAAEVDTNAANNTNIAQMTAVTPVANLSVTKTDAPDPVNQGSNITYSIMISNAGPSPATGVVATDVVPANVTFVSATGSQGMCALAMGTVTCNVGTIASGGNATATVIMTATAVGMVSNTINVASAVADPNMANNSATATTTVNVPAAVDFSIGATPSIQNVARGGTATVTITLTPLPIGGSFNTAINLGCAGVFSCMFSSGSVTPGAMPGTSTLSIAIPASGAVPPPAWPPAAQPPLGWWLLLALTLAGVPLLARLALWRQPALAPFARMLGYCAQLALLLVALAALATQTACSDMGVSRGPYTVTVTATSGAISHSTTVTVNVQ